jgi:hypothetical protein
MQFVSDEMERFLFRLGIQHVKSNLHYPRIQRNGREVTQADSRAPTRPPAKHSGFSETPADPDGHTQFETSHAGDDA